MSSQHTSTGIRLPRRALLGAAALGGAGLLTWGATRLAGAESVDATVARWRQEHAVGEQYDEIHQIMRDYMEAHQVRAGSLAIRTRGELRLSSGYTFAEDDYPTTRPDSLFRLASVSKAFACAAVHRLADEGVIDLSTPVFPFLGISTVALPGQTKDPRIDTVTVRQLVDHTGGWDRAAGFDPIFQGRHIARALELPGRVSKRDVAHYMYGEPLQNAPGDVEVYSNFGYLLLGLVVEQATGTDFTEFVTTEILTPLGVENEVFLGNTIEADALDGEVGYDATGTGLSAWDPYSDVPVPAAYGTFLIAECDSSGGLVATTAAVTALIAEYAVWGLGERSPGYYRTGAMAGTSTRATSLNSGVDWSYTFNARGGEANLNDLGSAINAAIVASDIGD
ncbi:CubicO group peptidase (beta-lactamase class C family) [Stackebrandtia endophytica]|uniref:CubicO group peptidase (Beta-lactamase class C family) n=1 Tax=Stackebrandtia endophytica TaxID=1496996 RepID=A0A543AR71_9ACTN|nr:serine hydrolase domain-containing protein [Stackebrandtia endophytica]TQL75025.1 CubicO group peptidase (beta-lactamase class C family) [Stackebrandtia endophytica]